MPQIFKYFTLDVLVDERVKGIPLSVVVTEEELEFAKYSRIARKFESSDTSFVRYSEETNTLEVRSFSSNGVEKYWDRHNLLGAVHTVLFNEHLFKPNLDQIPEIFMQGSSISISVNNRFLKLLHKPALLKNEFDLAKVANAMCLTEYEMDIPNLKPTIVETDLCFLIVPVKNHEILNRCTPKKEFLQSLLVEHEIQGVYCFSLSEEGSEFLVNMRFFNTKIGIIENSQTLNSDGALADFLKFHGYFKENHEYAILQEEAMGRSSVIRCKVEKNLTLIGGTATITGENAIYV